MRMRDSQDKHKHILEPDSRDHYENIPLYLYLGYTPVHYTYHYTPAQ